MTDNPAPHESPLLFNAAGDIIQDNSRAARVAELLKERPRKQATEMLARMLNHLYPRHGFMFCEREDGARYVVHFEGDTDLCGGLIDVSRDADNSDPMLTCSKCGRIAMNLKHALDEQIEDPVAIRLTAPDSQINRG